MSRVVLAMSGGVDSSVAAHLLLQQGHEVIGVFMRRGIEVPAAGCAAGGPTSSPLLASTENASSGGPRWSSADDTHDVRRVADHLRIAFEALDLRAEFSQIVDYFVTEYTAGRTPNPCAMCNARLKFGRLFGFADSVGAEFLATGHYARVVPTPGSGIPELHRGIDAAKDQSYALFGIQRQMLQRMLLPIGQYEKPQIRELAGRLGLPVAEKPDSQEICFVPQGEHDRFVREHRDAGIDTSGDLVGTDGRVLGRHTGIERFTIGQRRGLGVALGQRAFVVRIEPDTKRVVIGKREDLARRELTANCTNWLVDPPSGAFRCQAKIRYNAQAAPATVEILPDDRLRAQFDQPCYGVAPGQALVCYDGDRVLGGGWIES